MLEVSNLNVMLGGRMVLRDVAFSVPAGATVALVGRNGAGKTTLLRSVMGLVALKGGSIRLQDQALDASPAHHRTASGIGYAPEDRVIYPAFSVQENLALPCQVLGLSAAEIAGRLDDVLAMVPQLKPMLRRSGAALSGGQGKIVALGRALMVGSRLVLLDEPFQGLAPVLAEQYGNALRTLRQARPELSVIVTESNASLLEGVQSRTLYLERGVLQDQAVE